MLYAGHSPVTMKLYNHTDLVLLWLLPALVLSWPASISDLWSSISLPNNRLLSNASDFLDRTAKVLNFFPIPVSDECRANDNRRSGICLNPYECRIQNGQAFGQCALGFGVCCVFTATCGSEIANNITYFVSPDFPSLSRGVSSCEVKVNRIADDVSQLRLDFVHFNLGQPNRRTGVCDSDIFVMRGGQSKALTLCGQNSGQHFYFDLDNTKDPVMILMNMTQDNLNRMWEVKISQIEFTQRAPAGCAQFFQAPTGIIQTMNFAVNGRHLADQDYNICVRQEENMCSIVYEPCDENSFKIGPAMRGGGILADSAGSGAGPLSDPGAGGGGGSSEPQECSDRVIMPCENEEFIMPQGSPSTCDLLHCGNSLCSAGVTPCKIESAIRPFNIRVQFGPGTREENPEDNLGMCLKYQQMTCS